MSAGRLLLLFAVAHLLFATWPGIDLWASALVFDGEGFPLARSEALHRVRHAIWNAVIAATLGSLALWLVWLSLGSRTRVAARVWAFPVAVMLAGPILLVNGLLKAHWGRARPADAAAFGGEAAFTPPFQMAGDCEGNCSFVSGEGSGAVAMALALGLLVPQARLRAALGALALLACGLRVATGRHYLSDVVFGALLMAFVALGLFRLLGIERARRTLTRANLAHDLRRLAPWLRRA